MVASIKLNPRDVTPTAVHEATLAARDLFKREEERMLVEDVRQRTGEGWAVSGVSDTLRALARGQVRTLLVSRPMPASKDSAVVGRSPRARTHGSVAARATRVPVVDVIDDAIEDALASASP